MAWELLDGFFGHFRWYRRLRRGHWERWWVDSPVNDEWWHRTDRCRAKMPDFDGPNGRPSAGCRGTPTCEEW